MRPSAPRFSRSTLLDQIKTPNIPLSAKQSQPTNRLQMRHLLAVEKGKDRRLMYLFAYAAAIAGPKEAVLHRPWCLDSVS
jgi:hypothetical protein